MRLVGLARTVLTWVVGVHLVAIALAGPLLLLWLRAGDSQAQALLLTLGPVCGALGVQFASRSFVQGSLTEPVAPTAAISQAFAERGVTSFRLRPAPGLAPGEAVVVRSLRALHVFLPPSPDGAADPAAVPEAVRQLRIGSAAVAPLQLAVCGWLRGWVDNTRFALAPVSRRRLDPLVRVRLVPLLLLAVVTAPMVAVAYLAALAMTLLVGPGTARRLARVSDTEDGRPRQVRDRQWGGPVPILFGSGLTYRFATSVLQDVPQVAGATPVGVLGLPRAVAAGLTGASSISQVPAALMIALVAYFTAMLPAQRLVWPGEHLVTARVVQAQYGGDAATRYLSVRVDGAQIPTPDGSRVLRAGETYRLVARAAGSGLEYRDPLQSSLAAILVPLVVGLLLALVALVLGPRMLLGPDAEPAAAPGASPQPSEQTRSSSAGRLLRLWPLWIGVVVASGMAAYFAGALGSLVGRTMGAVSTGRSVGGAVGFAVAFAMLAYLLVRSVIRRGDPRGLVDASDAASGSEVRDALGRREQSSPLPR